MICFQEISQNNLIEIQNIKAENFVREKYVIIDHHNLIFVRLEIS
jgi:hypothetical protein